MTLARKKLIGIITGFLVYSFVFFILAGLLIRSDYMSSALAVGLMVIFAIIWPAFAAVTAAFSSGQRTFGVVAAIGSGVAVLMGGLFSIASLVAGILMVLLLVYGENIIRQEMQTRVTFGTRLIFLRGVRVMLLALLVSILGLATPLVQNLVASGQLVLPDRYVAAALRPAAPVLDSFIPGGYSGNKTVNDVINAQIAEQLATLPSGTTIPDSGRQQARDDLSEFLGVPITGVETVPELAADYINRYIQQLADQSGVLVSLVMIVIALLALRALIPLLVWPTLVIIAGFIWVSRRVGLAYISQIQGTIERLYL